MKKIKIINELKNQLPDFHIGVLSFKAQVYDNKEIGQVMHEIENQIQNSYELNDILTIDNIKAARDGYKTLRKDPSRYRLAVESLYRRIVKGNHIYRVNNLVDIGNILSIETARSIAVLDEDKIKGDVIIRIGRDEDYEGIGRGKINIENIPVYCDEIGPFGSPTSDTLRTAISDQTKQVLLLVISFNGDDLNKDLNLAIDLYSHYAKASDFQYLII